MVATACKQAGRTEHAACVCPHDALGLDPRPMEGRAAWYCRAGKHAVAPIGELPAASLVIGTTPRPRPKSSSTGTDIGRTSHMTRQYSAVLPGLNASIARCCEAEYPWLVSQ